MNITAEVSLYPLQDDYEEKILEFLERMHVNERISVETTAMSTLFTGNYETIMNMLTEEMQHFFRDQKAVFIIKISNGCIVNDF